MRRMRLNLAALAVVLFGLAASSLQSQEVVNLTNQVWRYEQSGADPGAFWEPAYDDSLWPEGRGIFALETSAAAQLTANVYPFTNTSLAIGQTIPYYFRTHFNFSLGNPNDYVLTARSLIDDGYIIYLNGVEVNRYNMNATSDAAAAANPAGEGVPVIRTLDIPLGGLINGDNVLAVAAYQNNITSSDIVFGTALTASLGYRPRILSPTAPSSITVEQGRGTNLTVVVDAAPPATIQWQLDTVDIPGATAATYSIVDMDSTKAGVYRAVVSNTLGTSNSPTTTVSYQPDVTPPALVHASADAVDLTRISLYFSENITAGAGQDPLDPIFHVIENINDPNDVLGVASVVYGATSNIFVLSVSPARTPGQSYRAVISLHPPLTDLFGNPLPDPSSVNVGGAVTVQQGLNGYTGTLDTEVRENLPDSAAGGALLTVNTDTADPNAVHSLLRFDNLGLPSGAVVLSARLSIWTDNVTTAGTPIRMLRMLAFWDESSTWNSMGSGINQTNGVEAGATDAIIDGSQDDSLDVIDVTAAVQAWANGAPNYGWAFLPTGDDGWRWNTSEAAANQPSLTMDFYVPPNPCNIQDQPDSVTVNEKSPFTLAVQTLGSDLRFQWFRNNVAIPNATNSSYAIARAVPANAGTYRVVIQNDIPSSCTSSDAVVTVIPDTQRPVLTSSFGNFDQTTIALTFNDTLDPVSAGNAANYTLNNGVTVSSALVAGNTVTLTTATPRVVGTDYTLTITGVRDDAAVPNPIDPNPTSTNLVQQVRFLPFGSSWKFETNGTDLGTAWKEVGYDDSAWPSDVALLGNENTAGTATALAALGLNTNNIMLWPLIAGGPAQIITYYLRGSVNIPYDLSPANATVVLRQVIDDGSVYYFNGTERFRFDMPAGDVTYLTEAVGATGEGVIRSQNLTNISCGDNLIAVSVHNDTPTSTDILFDAEVLVTFTSFQACAIGPRLSIVNNGDGTVTLSWAPAGGNLQESGDLTNWVPSSRTNGGTFTPAGFKFYRVAP